MNREMFSTKEVAEYLGINEKQVYRLANEKKIPATRVTGKWVFPKNLIDEWIESDARDGMNEASDPTISTENLVVIAGSNDVALDMLVKNVSLLYPQYTFSISTMGSLAGLVALRKGGCHIAATHLLDHETGEYNSLFIKEHFPDTKMILLNVAYREQGLIVKKGNPCGIKNLKSLVNKNVKIINRQEGSGTRLLFDCLLRENGIDPEKVKGYDHIACTHMEVAIEVFSGSADAGMGIKAAARMLDLDFVPLTKERFDLAIPTAHYSTEPVKALRKTLSSADFKSSVAEMGGYEVRDTGRVVYERA